MKNGIIVLLSIILLSCGIQNNDKKEEPTSEKKYQIGVTQIVDHPALNSSREGFLKALEDNGISSDIDYKNPNGEITTAQLIAKEFVEEKKDLILAITTPSAQTVQNATETIPVVFASVTDPKGAGLTGKANITGTSGMPAINENFKLLKQILPKTKTIGIIYNTSEQNSKIQIDLAKKFAEENGLELKISGVTNSNELVSSVDSMLNQIDVFYAIQDNFISSNFNVILEKTIEKKIPVFGSNSVYSENGGLISQGVTDYDIGYRAGEMAAAILKGEKSPSDIPIEELSKLTIFVNEKNKEELGININLEGLEIKYIK